MLPMVRAINSIKMIGIENLESFIVAAIIVVTKPGIDTIMFSTTLIWCSILAITGSKVAILINKNKNAEKWMNRTSGFVFILLGLKVALTKK